MFKAVIVVLLSAAAQACKSMDGDGHEWPFQDHGMDGNLDGSVHPCIAGRVLEYLHAMAMEGAFHVLIIIYF